jgi:hypothetical protein
MSVLTYNIAKDLEAAFNHVGSSMMSADFAAKLLAYVYVMGGGNEAVTMHEGLNAGIAIAQQKFNLNGGEIPNRMGIELIKKYIAELEKNEKETTWLHEIFGRYNLKMQ